MKILCSVPKLSFYVYYISTLFLLYFLILCIMDWFRLQKSNAIGPFQEPRYQDFWDKRLGRFLLFQYRLCYHFSLKASKLHYWFKSYGDFAEWVNFAYRWSCSAVVEGLRSRALHHLFIFELIMFWRFWGKGWLTKWMNYYSVCRTAPATMSLLYTWNSSKFYICPKHLVYIRANVED